jgi:hypothetical protein
MKDQYKVLAEKYEQMQEAATDPYTQTNFLQDVEVVREVMLRNRKQFIDFVEKHNVFYLVGKQAFDGYKKINGFEYYDITNIKNPSILDKIISLINNSINANHDSKNNLSDIAKNGNPVVFFNLENAKKCQKMRKKNKEITKFFLKEILNLDRIYNMFFDEDSWERKLRELNNYLYVHTKNDEHNFTGIYFANFSNPNVNGHAGVRKHHTTIFVSLSIHYLKEIALAEEQNINIILQEVYDTLYHEYVHYIQYIKQRSYLTRKLSTRDVRQSQRDKDSSNSKYDSTYYNKSEEIMAHASNAANQFLTKYKTPQNAIKAFNQVMSKPTIQKGLEDRGYTPKAKKKFFRYVVDYINLIASGQEKSLQNPS